MLSTSANADAIADAASLKAMQSPKGTKRQREAIAKKARLVALACNLRDMRITMRTTDAANPPGRECAAQREGL